MEIKQNRIGWRFWFLWIIANLAGWLLSIGVIFLLVTLGLEFGRSGEEAALYVLYIALPIGGGIFAGFAQWLVIRRYIPHVEWWGVLSLFFWLFGGAAVLGWMSDFTRIIVLWTLPNIVCWLVLWRFIKQKSSQAARLTLGVIFYWLIGCVLMYVLDYLDSYPLFIYLTLASFPISGGILVWILRNPEIRIDKNAG